MRYRCFGWGRSFAAPFRRLWGVRPARGIEGLREEERMLQEELDRIRRAIEEETGGKG